MKKIPVAGPWITELEVKYAADAAATAWYDDANAYVARFETAFAAYVGRRFAVALPSCTSAIHLALIAWGIGDDDEVIVPDATWIASCAPVSYVGAKIVLADIDPATWCLDPLDFERLITPRTRAVVVVDLYGNMPTMDAILAVARERGIRVLEDSAEAIGSRYRGKPAGAFGDVSVFSFHGSKTLTTGEGGMLVTDDEDLLARVLFLRDHGRRPGDRQFFNTEIAHKYKMSALQAALGLAQLQRIEELVGKKRTVFSWYQRRLPGTDLVLNPEADEVFNSFWMSTVLWPGELRIDKFDLLERLAAKGVMTRPFFSPLSSLPAFAKAPDGERARAANSASYDICARGLNLPSALNLEENDIDRAISMLLEELDRVAPGRYPKSVR